MRIVRPVQPPAAGRLLRRRRGSTNLRVMKALPWRFAVAIGAVAAIGVLAAAVLPGTAQRDGPGPRVDALFAPWTGPRTPGCAVSVMRGGELVFAKGYGAANLEYDVPITPSTVFHVASVSKQFTALAVALLVADGEVSWDDDIRRYVPELPDFGTPITLRHLAHHTSGIRDQWAMLQMAGWRWGGDVIRQSDVLDLLSRQTALNFAPGSDHVYSNSGYTLLAVVVERVSGQTLRAFTRARLFRPLGMTRTVFRDDHTMLVRDRAYAYTRAGSGRYRLSIPDFAIVGATSLFTTVEDLARWNGNFSNGEIGGPDVLRQLQARGALDDGARLSYAFGLAHGVHRGRRTIGHGGTDAAYRSEFLRFLDEDLAVAVLCNTDRAAPARLARDVADVFLPRPPGVAAPVREASRPSAPRRPRAPAAGRGETGGGTADPASLAGYYRRPGNDVPLRVIARGDDLVLLGAGAEQSLHPAGGGRFRLGGTTEVTFTPGGGGQPPTLRVGDPPRPVYSRALPARPSAEALAAYAGSYYSDDLAVGYTFRVEAGRLVLWNRKLGRIPLAPTFADGFYAVGWYFTFRRDDAGAVSGFTVSTSRAWNIAFRKRG